MKYTIAAFSVAVALIVGAVAQEARADDPVPVNADNFVRAESDLYFGNVIKDAGGVGTLLHHRDMGDIARQSVIRLNRDTLYSAIVLDLEAGPATITLPDAGERFMSLQVINEDQYTTELHYGGGSYPLSKDSVGTRYVLAGVRTLANPNDPADLAAVHALQDAIKIEQPGGPGTFEVPAWDKASQDATRKALLALANGLPDTKKMFGTKDQVDPVRRLIGAASAWGGNPEEGALSQRHPGQERWDDRPQAGGAQGCAGRGVLVGEPLQRRGLLRAERAQRLHLQPNHGQARRGWIGDHPVRWLRGRCRQLPADRGGVELHGAALSAQGRDPRWQLEIPGGAARELSPRVKSS